MNELNKGEKKFCEFQLGMTGDFFTALIKAMFLADVNNVRKLKLAFPEVMATVKQYQNMEGYWSDLKDRWNFQTNGRKFKEID